MLAVVHVIIPVALLNGALRVTRAFLRRATPGFVERPHFHQMPKRKSSLGSAVLNGLVLPPSAEPLYHQAPIQEVVLLDFEIEN